MANLYLWFPNQKNRREFVLELLEIDVIKRRSKSKEANNEAKRLQEDLDNAISRLEAGRTKSPWYQLHRTFFDGRVPDADGSMLPWSAKAVFEKGFRRIYTQKSYWFRPGFWLVLQFRNTKVANERRLWVLEQIPEERLGYNVPIPVIVLSQWKIEWVDDAMAEVTWFDPLAGKSPEKCLEYLKDVKEQSPELFDNGDNVYLWEKLAFTFNALGDIQNAEFCLRSQAEFQPGCADAFLNLGNFLHHRGMDSRAIAAWEEGLQIDPGDEFIYSNLSSLYLEQGRKNPALTMINEAILKNPSRGLNFKIKGDIHLDSGEYEAAINSYIHAIKLFNAEGNSMIVDTYGLLAGVHKLVGDYEKALSVLQQALVWDPQNVEIMADVARTRLYLNMEEDAKD